MSSSRSPIQYPKSFQLDSPIKRLFPLNDQRVAVACQLEQDGHRHNRSDRSKPSYMLHYATYTVFNNTDDTFRSTGTPWNTDYQPRVLKNGLFIHMGEPLPPIKNPYTRDIPPTSIGQAPHPDSSFSDHREVKELLDPEISGFISAGPKRGYLLGVSASRDKIYCYTIASAKYVSDSVSIPLYGDSTIDYSEAFSASLHKTPKAPICVYECEAKEQEIQDLAVIEGSEHPQLALLFNTGEIQLGDIQENKWVNIKNWKHTLSTDKEMAKKAKLFYSQPEKTLLLHDKSTLYYHHIDKTEDENTGIPTPPLFNVSISCSGKFISGLIDCGRDTSHYVQIFELSKLHSSATIKPFSWSTSRALTDLVIGYQDLFTVAVGSSLIHLGPLSLYLKNQNQLILSELVNLNPEMAIQTQETGTQTNEEPEPDSASSADSEFESFAKNEISSSSSSRRNSTSSLGLYSLFRDGRESPYEDNIPLPDNTIEHASQP